MSDHIPLYKNPYCLLGLILLLHVVCWLLLKPIWPNGPSDDPFQYAWNANRLLSHTFHLNYDPYPNRFGVFVPVSFFFCLFGENPYTISLWPLVSSLFTISLVFVFLNKLTTSTIALFASFLIAVNIQQIAYSLELYPDLIVSLYAAAAVLVLYYGREKTEKKILFAALFNLILLLGFLTKETILLLGPFLVITLIADLIQKKHHLFWKWTIGFSVLTLLALFEFYALLTGDPFNRIKSLADLVLYRILDEDMSKSITDVNSSNIFVWLNHNLGYIFLLLFSIPTLLESVKGKWDQLRVYISVYTLIMLAQLILIFHTPKMGIIYMQDRHWMFLIVPLAILSAAFFSNPDKKHLRLAILLLSTLALYNYLEWGLLRGLLFFLFAGVSAFDYFWKRRRSMIWVFPFLILLSHFVSSNSNYRPANANRSMKIQNQK
jgi:4-amino-4-deoxy-L-arabinose transferase-like glycosyltransferase